MSDMDDELTGDAGASAANDNATDARPWVRLPCEGHELSKFAAEVGEVLSHNGVYRRQDVIMTIDRERGVMVPMEANRFRTYVERHCRPARFVWGKNNPRPEMRPMTMSREVATGTLASDDFVEQQRPLQRVNLVPSPVMRQSGADAGKVVLLGPGYDAESRTFTVGVEGVEVRTDMEMEEAREVLENLLKEFPFAERGKHGASRSKAVHIAAMLSVYAPGLIPLAAARPGVLWIANAPRSGKTLLAKTVQVPVFGTAKVTAMKTEEEFDKVLDTAALESWPVLFLDNLTGLFRSPSLDAFMTSPTRRSRLMASQRSFEAQRTTQVLVTGNNLTLSEDLEERFLICELFLESMDPRDRKIERRIDEVWLARPEVRGGILSALWTLVSEWDAAGRPKCSASVPGFEDWAEVYGGIVEHAGFGNPLERPKLEYGGDESKRDLLAMLDVLADDVRTPDLRGKVNDEDVAAERAAAEKRTSREYTFAELVDCCRAHDLFSGWIEGRELRVEGEMRFEISAKTRSRLGKYFAAQFGGRVGKLPSGRRVRFGTLGNRRATKFALELLPES